MADGKRRYQQLSQSRSDLFNDRDENVYPICAADPATSSVLWEDQYVLLLRDKVQFPDGKNGGYIRLISPPDGARGVAILPVMGNQVILLHHPRHATGQFHMEIPRGFGEAGQSSAENARRELFEETGIVASDLTELGKMFPDTGLQSTCVDLFLTKIAADENQIQPEKGVSCTMLSVDAAVDLVADGKITDSFTMAALFRARLRGLI